MLSTLLGGPVVEVLEVDESHVFFRSPRELGVGREVPVRVALDAGWTCSVQVSIQNSRRLDSGGYACRAEVRDRLKLPMLHQAHCPSPGDPRLRKDPRMSCYLRVRSSTLEGCGATALDVTAGGLQLRTARLLEPGELLEVTLEFDLQGFCPVTCRGRVAWSGPDGGGGLFRAGIEFVALDPASREQLQRYQTYLRQRGEAKMVHRLIYSDPHFMDTAQEGPRVDPVQGVVESYSVSSGVVDLTFRKSADGQRFRFRLSGCRGLVDHNAVTGNDLEIEKLCRKPSSGCTRFQFLDRRDRVCLEVVAACCELSLIPSGGLKSS